MGLRNPPPINPEQALAEQLQETKQRLNELESNFSFRQQQNFSSIEMSVIGGVWTKIPGVELVAQRTCVHFSRVELSAYCPEGPLTILTGWGNTTAVITELAGMTTGGSNYLGCSSGTTKTEINAGVTIAPWIFASTGSTVKVGLAVGSLSLEPAVS